MATQFQPEQQAQTKTPLPNSSPKDDPKPLDATLMTENDIHTSPLLPASHKPLILHHYRRRRPLLCGPFTSASSPAPLLIAAIQLSALSLTFRWYEALYNQWKLEGEACESMVADLVDAACWSAGVDRRGEWKLFGRVGCLRGREEEVRASADRLLRGALGEGDGEEDEAVEEEEAREEEDGGSDFELQEPLVDDPAEEDTDLLLRRVQTTSDPAETPNPTSAEPVHLQPTDITHPESFRITITPLSQRTNGQRRRPFSSKTAPTHRLHLTRDPPPSEIIPTPYPQRTNDPTPYADWAAESGFSVDRPRSENDFLHMAQRRSATCEDLDHSVWKTCAEEAKAHPDSLKLRWPPRGSFEMMCLMEKLEGRKRCEELVGWVYQRGVWSRRGRATVHWWCLRCYRQRRKVRCWSVVDLVYAILDLAFMLCGLPIVLAVEGYIAWTDERAAQGASFLRRASMTCSLFLDSEIIPGAYPVQPEEEPMGKPRHRSYSC